MHAEATRPRPAQCIGHQSRPQVRTTDADADDVGDLAGFQRLDQRAHAQLHSGGGGKGLAGDGRGRQVAAQRRVQGGAALGGIDRVAVEQAPEGAAQIAAAPQFEQRRPGLRIPALAGEGRVQRPDLQRLGLDPPRLVFQQSGDAGARQARGMGPELFETRGGDRHQAACLGME